MFDEKEIANQFNDTTFATGNGGPSSADFPEVKRVLGEIERKLPKRAKKPSLSEYDGEAEDA